jgi:hypothetical protein
VGLGTTRKTVALYHAGKTATFAGPDNINPFIFFEDISFDLIPLSDVW